MGYLPGLYDIFQERWGQSQSCYIYSDPHFNDDELAGGIKDRPSAEEQVKRINAKCGRRDCLIILGDVGDAEYVRQLRAEYKILIMGNHDAGSTRYKRHRDTIVLSTYDFTQEEAIEEMERRYPGYQIKFECMGNAGWVFSIDNKLFDEVYEGALIIGEKLILSHEPVDVPWLFNVHGHNHTDRKRQNHLNVCSDVIGWEPVNFTQFLKSGFASKIQTIHRQTIDKATERKVKSGGKKIGK